MSFDFAGFDAAFPWFFPVVAAVFGAIVGSFLNVVIYRVPLGRSVVHPGSRCACGTPIAWYDNIPIASWFILRGKARCCGRPYSIRYPFVEALTAALFLAAWIQYPPAKALAGAVFLGLLVTALFIDLDHMIIPDGISVGGAVVGVLLSGLLPALHGYDGPDPLIFDALRSIAVSVTGLLIGSSLVLWIALLAEAILKKEAMGFGDVKFVGMIGAFCGWQGALFSIFGGAIVGTVWIALALVAQKLRGAPVVAAPRAETPDGEPSDLRFGAQVPFGPMLAIAGGAYFLGIHRWFDPYLAQFGILFN